MTVVTVVAHDGAHERQEHLGNVHVVVEDFVPAVENLQILGALKFHLH